MKTNRLAIASAVLGIVAVVVECVCFVLMGMTVLTCIGQVDCLPIALIKAAPLWMFLLPASALVTGIIALRQIARSQHTQSGRGRALWGTVLGGLLLAGSVAIVVRVLLESN